MLSNQSDTICTKRRLPHLYQSNQPVFITWRLKFDLPNSILHHLKEMKYEFEQKIQDLSDEYKTMQRYTYHKKVFGWLDSQLATTANLPATLQKPGVSDIISDALKKDNSLKYCLHAYCIMPNHVHVLITPLSVNDDYANAISSITKSWKGRSAREINLLLGKTGTLWAPESYDHLVRNELEFSRIIQYVLFNPVKAKLVNNWSEWKYNWADDALIDIMG